MKKILGLILGLSLGLGSCSKDDNKENDFDPLFSLEYHPLKSLSELKGKKYKYSGIKVEGKKVGLLSETSTSCSRLDVLTFNILDGDELSTAEFLRNGVNCTNFDKILLFDFNLKQAGILSTKMSFNNIGGDKGNNEEENSWNAISTMNLNGRFNLQIGFQGEYLRIEDRMSHYVRRNPDEEVFLYFKEVKYLKKTG